MKSYVDSTGRVISADQAEQEYRKQRIVAGQSLDGEEYDKGLDAWYGTYREFTSADKRSVNASAITLGVGVGIAAVLGVVVLVAGGGIVGFAVTALVGSVAALIVAGLVMMLTTPAKDPSSRP